MSELDDKINAALAEYDESGDPELSHESGRYYLTQAIKALVTTELESFAAAAIAKAHNISQERGEHTIIHRAVLADDIDRLLAERKELK